MDNMIERFKKYRQHLFNEIKQAEAKLALKALNEAGALNMNS
jgi:hypothetical protein